MELQANSQVISSSELIQEPLLTVPETARLLSISESYLRHLIQMKRVPGLLRIGRAVRFDPIVLRTYRKELLDEANRD